MKKSFFTPIGHVHLQEEDGYITVIHLDDAPAAEEGDSEVLRQCQQQLEEYFAGGRRSFDFPMRQQGTDFQQRCLGATTANSIWQNAIIPGSFKAAWRCEGDPRCWHCKWPQSARHRRSLPPGHRLRPLAYRLCWRLATQAMAAGARGEMGFWRTDIFLIHLSREAKAQSSLRTKCLP
jgi:hypothetical protein